MARPRGSQRVHAVLTGGRSPWGGPDAFQSQMTDLERRLDNDELRRTLEVTKTTTPDVGYAIITDSSIGTVTLPKYYVGPLVVKNATGASLNIAIPAGSTLYDGTSPIVALDGEAFALVKLKTVWYIV